MTSSVLFSRKLEHIKANPRVSVAITDPVAVDLKPQLSHGAGRVAGTDVGLSV